MINTAVVSELPEKKNIKYVVCVDPGSLGMAFHPIIDEIRKYRENTGRQLSSVIHMMLVPMCIST